MTKDLLPPGRTRFERAMASAMAIDVDPSVLRTLKDPDRCPPQCLPWLAWELAVDRFDAATTEAQQRALIKSAIEVHKHKGTVSAVRQVFRDLGLGEVKIDEGRHGRRYDGAVRYDGFPNYNDLNTGWAVYRVRLSKLLDNKQAALARQILDDVAPVRCQLWGLDFSEALLIYNAAARYNAAYTHGVA